MTCKYHPNYIPHNGDPTTIYRYTTSVDKDGFTQQPLPCPFCWQSRAYWLHENRKLHMVIAQDLREKAGHFTPDARVTHLEAQITKLTKQRNRYRDDLATAQQFIFNLGGSV